MRRKKLNKLVSVLIVLTLVLGSGISGFGATVFSDTSGHWAESSIDKGVSFGFIKGYTNGTFKPDSPVTRAEFSKMLNVALGLTDQASISFKDVSTLEWYYAEVRKAVAAGFINGYEDNTFRPNSKITRQEAAVMMAKVLPPVTTSLSLSGLKDNSSIADWARTGVTAVFTAGYMKGDDQSMYRPLGSLTRAEAATILTKYVEGENIITADTKVSSSTTLRDKIYVNDLTIDKALADNDLSIDGCLILGTLYVNGGGETTVTLKDTLARNMVIAKTTGDVRVLLTGYSTVNEASLTYGATLEHSSLRGEGFKVVNLDGSSLSAQEVNLIGSFKQVYINTASILKSTSGTISNLNITRSASGDTIKLSGTYTNVTLEAKAFIELLSGKISTLTINSSAGSSSVKMSSGTTITTAVVDGKTAFTGTGKISTMRANVNDITYETKPTTITVASDVTRRPVLSADITAPQPTFTPTDGATSVIPNTKITIVFDEPILKTNGNAVSTLADIQNIVELWEMNSTGSTKVTEIAYTTATISSDKKTITITPATVLNTNKYHDIIILAGTIEDANSNENAKITSSFKTGTQDVAAPTVTFSPANGATNIAVATPITVSFNEAVIKYSGSALTSNDFQLSDTKNIIVLKKTTSSGADVAYSAVVATDKETVTITPETALENGATYYIAVKANTLKDDSNNVIPLTSATFSTVSLNSLKAITSFAFSSPSVTGTINEGAHTISVTVPYGTAVTNLTPTIVKTGVSVSPNSGIAVNFTNPVNYTVTASDATTQVYVVTVIVSDPPKAITSFGFASPAVSGSINQGAGTINLTVPFGTDVSALVPTIVQTGESVTPNSGDSADFTSPVVYTVTALDSTVKTYTVTVNVTPASTNSTVTSTIYTVTETEITNVAPNTSRADFINNLNKGQNDQAWNDTGINDIVVSEDTLVVTAQDGSSRTYTITVNAI